jgi:hypothetical protein
MNDDGGDGVGVITWVGGISAGEAGSLWSSSLISDLVEMVSTGGKVVAPGTEGGTEGVMEVSTGTVNELFIHSTASGESIKCMLSVSL